MRTGIFALLMLASLPVFSKAAAQPLTKPRVQGQGTKRATSGTVSIDLRDNRIFVQLTCVRQDGSLRQARFQVDSGGGAVILSESLSHDLALKGTGSPSKGDEDEMFQPVNSPQIRIGEMPLDLTGVSTVVPVGSKSEFSAGSGAEGFLPARVLRKYEVVFDYPARQFTVAQSGALKPRGVPVPSPVASKSGFPRVELSVDGQEYGFLLDTGAAYTMVSQTLMDKWHAAHPDWPRCIGAVGAANMVGGTSDAKAEMLRVPEMRWGTFNLPRVGVVSRPPGTFEKWMSGMMSAPIVGSIAGNMLRAFRIEIDYRHGVTYLQREPDASQEALNVVGVVIGARPDGTYMIGGSAQCGGKDAIEGVQLGDKLVQINDWTVKGSLADVLDHLRGKPGETKSLTLEWKGKRLAVKANVASIF